MKFVLGLELRYVCLEAHFWFNEYLNLRERPTKMRPNMYNINAVTTFSKRPMC